MSELCNQSISANKQITTGVRFLESDHYQWHCQPTIPCSTLPPAGEYQNSRPGNKVASIWNWPLACHLLPTITKRNLHLLSAVTSWRHGALIKYQN